MFEQKKWTHPLYWSVLFCLTVGHLLAQENQTLDTLALARQTVDNGDFGTAIQMLQPYGKNHPNNSDAKDLLAHIYYWNGDVELAQKTFERAMEEHPRQSNLKLGYGRMLFETKHFDKAKSLFSQFLESDPSNAEALLNLGYIHFWKEEYKTAENFFQQILRNHPGQPEATKMLADIKALRSVALEINGDYRTDSQLLESFHPSVKASQYHNRWLHPSIKGEACFFEIENGNRQAQHLELGNHFYFKKPKFDLALSGGVYRNHFDEKINWIGKAVLKKQMTKGLVLSIHTGRTPNTTTLASLEQLVFMDEHSIQFQLMNGDSWMGQAAVVHRNHGDKNPIYSVYAWGMSPVLKASIFQMRIGYAFSFADSKESRFQSESPLSHIIDNWQEEQEITGIYNPYFTPENQQIHAALAYLKISFSKKINIECNGNVGFLAKSDIPYLFLDLIDNELDLSEGLQST